MKYCLQIALLSRRRRWLASPHRRRARSRCRHLQAGGMAGLV